MSKCALFRILITYACHNFQHFLQRFLHFFFTWCDFKISIYVYIGCTNDWLSGVCKRIGDIISKHLCADEKCLVPITSFFYFVEKMYIYWSHFLLSSCKGFKFHINLSLWKPRIKILESCHKDIGCQNILLQISSYCCLTFYLLIVKLCLVCIGILS